MDKKMNKNDIFDFGRFGKYFTSDLRTCAANYGLTLFVISIIVQIALYLTSVGMNGLFSQTWQGPGVILRVSTFIIAMVCMTITMPVKCYGRITEKQYGSFWISIPASRLEKFLSMIILTCIVVPVIGVVLYLSVDWLICLVDKTCGQNIIAGVISVIKDLNIALDEMAAEEIMLNGTLVSMDFIKQIYSPWLYIDEFFVMSLPFLLGAIFFKSAKTVKTFLMLAAIGATMSMIMTPLTTGLVFDIMGSAGNEEEIAARMLNSGVMKNLGVIDTIADAITNLALMAGIWFRIKTLKH